jgi:hypothetical protein
MMSQEGGSHPKHQDNVEQENFNEKNIWLSLNEGRNDNQS